MQTSLTNESITFGKYKGLTLGHILKDRSYCKWLLEQNWFENGYEYLYNRIREYNPGDYFIRKDIEDIEDTGDFIGSYPYFNLYSCEEVHLPLTEAEKTCYGYYLDMITHIKEKIYQRLENDEENPFDISAPTKWLQVFEKKCGIPRQDFKEFIAAYELPNITTVIERVKKEGGLEYKGARSFLIAKERSQEQEKWWEDILKSKYGEDLGTQFKYCRCIFDFININTNTIFECKLGLKDFSEDQHIKYKLALNTYRIIYLISNDCVIDMERKKIYSNNTITYQIYQQQIPIMKDPSYLDNLIQDFEIEDVNDLSVLFG